jgi:hypothetical protein
MQGRCDKHLFEAAEDQCGKCGYEFCADCLVYSFGAKKPPFCIPCAVAAAGVRSTAGNRPMADARELRTLKKERRSAFRRARREPAVEAEEELLRAALPATPPLVQGQY